LKVMEPTLAVDQSFTQRFLKEGRTIAQFQHSNIVTIYDCGSHGSKYYLTMEFLPGGTLDQQIKEGLTLERSLMIIKQIAKALAYAHQHGVIHRDLKPKNILFRKDGTPVLTDFGIAKVLDANTQLTALGTVMGSPHYMSPEQVTGKPLDARSDLYSLGIVLYEMLVKQPPYQAPDVISLAMMHCTAPLPVLPKGFNQFQPLLQKLLAKNPNERFDNAEQLIQALESLPVSQPAAVSDQTVPIATPPRRGVGQSTSRMKTGLAAGSVLLLAIAGGGTYLLVSRQSAPPSLTPLTPTTTGEDRAAARRLAEEEAKRRAEEEAKQRAKEEAKRRAEEEAKQRAEEEAKQRAADEARQRAAAEEAKQRAAAEEAKRRADEEVKQRATEEEAKRRAAAEKAKQRAAEEEPRLKATAEELKRQAMDEAKRKAAEEAKRQAAEEAKRRADEEARRQATQDAKRRATEEAKRRATEEAKRRAAEPAPKPPPTATTTNPPSQTTREVRDQQRSPSRSTSQSNRRCVDILNRESLGDVLSSSDIAFKMKECR
jgi:serine/threonine-protein kinase PpkA